MGKRKGGLLFDPRIVDDIPEVPTLPEIKRLDAVLASIVDALVKHEVRSVSHAPDARRAPGTHHARPTCRKRTV